MEAVEEPDSIIDYNIDLVWNHNEILDSVFFLVH